MNDTFDSETQLLESGIIAFRACACVLVTAMLIVMISKKQRDRIPGPTSLPLLGTMLQIGLEPQKAFERMRKKYGDVFEVTIGAQRMIIISGYDTIKESLATKSELFAGRPDMFTSKFLSNGKSLSFTTNTPEWHAHRQLTERALRLLANGSDFLNGVVTSEAELFSKKMISTDGKAIDPAQDILWSVAHIKYSMCFGNSRQEQHAKFEKLIRGTLEIVDGSSSLNFFPVLRWLAAWKCVRYNRVCGDVCEVATEKEHEHERTFRSGFIRDALDALIHVGRNSKHMLDQQRLLHTSQDFMGAGLDIVYVALTWCVLYLAQFPEIQRNIKAEIRRVIMSTSDEKTGKRRPRKEDMKSMPYTQAFIYEVLRHSSVVPFALPHSNIRDTHIKGLHIPRNSFILTSLYSVHHDPAIWGDPAIFRPTRFLDSTGESLCKSTLEKFVPCGVGRRKCVGEALAKQEMFLYVTTLLQQCDVIKPQDQETPYDLEPVFGLCLKPKPFQVSFVPAS